MKVVDIVFFFNDTATTEIYTLSLHDALPILNPLKPSCCRNRGRTCSLISRSTSSISCGGPSNVLILACKVAYLLSAAYRACRTIPFHRKNNATPSPTRTSNRGEFMREGHRAPPL